MGIGDEWAAGRPDAMRGVGWGLRQALEEVSREPTSAGVGMVRGWVKREEALGKLEDWQAQAMLDWLDWITGMEGLVPAGASGSGGMAETVEEPPHGHWGGRWWGRMGLPGSWAEWAIAGMAAGLVIYGAMWVWRG